MLRRLFTFSALVAILSLPLSAQSLHISQGAVTIGVPAPSAGEMTYADGGTTLTVMGRTYTVADIDSMVYHSEAVEPQTVKVTYEGTTARVFASADVAPYLSFEVNGADVSITASSELTDEVNYVLSGNSYDGSFLHTGTLKSTLTLSGLTLTNTRGAAIDIQNGKRIAIIIADGTENTLVDGTGGTQKACFYVKGHSEFSGSGTLNVTGNTKHALSSNEYAELAEGFGAIHILGAVSDGMHVGQYYDQRGGTISIQNCGGDGIDCEATTDLGDEQNGQFFLRGGSITVDLGATEDVKGIKSDSLMTISGGSISVTGTGDGVKGIKTGGSLLVDQSSGNTTSITINVTGTTYHKDEVDESKTRGIKVDGDFTFDGGTINVSATGKKAKPVSVDGTYYYKSGTINCAVDATTVG